MNVLRRFRVRRERRWLFAQYRFECACCGRSSPWQDRRIGKAAFGQACGFVFRQSVIGDMLVDVERGGGFEADGCIVTGLRWGPPFDELAHTNVPRGHWTYRTSTSSFTLEPF